MSLFAACSPSVLESVAILERAANPPDSGACLICGCTEHNPCPGGCYWVFIDELCSECAAKLWPDVKEFLLRQFQATEEQVRAAGGFISLLVGTTQSGESPQAVADDSRGCRV